MAAAGHHTDRHADSIVHSDTCSHPHIDRHADSDSHSDACKNPHADRSDRDTIGDVPSVSTAATAATRR